MRAGNNRTAGSYDWCDGILNPLKKIQYFFLNLAVGMGHTI